MFWLASRPNQALSWSQAGGSLKADSAGVWWGSMPFGQRFKQPAFIENQKKIEEDWDKDFQDRKNEIVIIGININEKKITSELESCLLTEKELETLQWKEGYKDEWPIERTYPLLD